jgi:putative colanic acid biosynthesis acetyltransferase WcaF
MYPWLLEVGDWVSIADGVTIYNLGRVRIGSHSAISQGSHICAGSHDYARADLPLTRPPITIGAGVWVAADAFVGPGVTVGDNSVVGARAVVTRDVPPGVVVAGNPARVIKQRPMPAPAAT